MNHEAEKLLAAFWQRLQRNSTPVLLLDYDGTLAPFRVARDQAFPYPGVRQRLAALLEHSGTRLVIVSGRTVTDLLPLLGMEPHPEIWGCHGWERLLPSGEYRLGDLPAAARSALDKAAAWIAGRGLEAHSESKPASVTLHWRGLDEQSAAGLRRSATAVWRPLAEEVGLELHEFDGGLELRHPGRDKGSAVREVLAETPPAAAIAYLGDDLTDEDAFRALHGRGLSILVRSQRRTSSADLWLRPPEELLEFLDTWLQQASGGKDYEPRG